MQEIRNDFQEITTDGFHEIVLKGNENYRTSSELRSAADDAIKSASDALHEATVATKSLIDALCDQATHLQEKRIKVQGLYMDSLTDISALKKEKFSTSLKAPILHWNPDDEYLFFGIRSMPEPLARSERVSAAKAYYSSAQDYTVQVNAELVRIHDIQIKIAIIEQAIKDENHILDILNSLASHISASEKPDIVSRIEIILQENLISDKTERGSAYKKAISDLTQICQKYNRMN